MVDYTYTYLLMGTLFVLVWLLLFLLNPPLRKEMFLIGAMWAILGSTTDFVYFRDWWSPVTLNGSAFSLEIFVAAFGICGTASVLHKALLRKAPSPPSRDLITGAGLKRVVILIAPLYLFFFGGSFWLGLNSFVVTIIVLLVPTLLFWWQDRRLISGSLVNGVMLLLVATIIYSILEFLTPGWIEAFYHFRNTPHIVVLNMPIDDAVWYFLAGAFFAAFLPWWQGSNAKNGVVR